MAWPFQLHTPSRQLEDFGLLTRRGRGIDFKQLKGRSRDRLLQRLAGKVNLQSRRRPIGRNLVGHDVVKAIEISEQRFGVTNIEEELLFEILLRWCQDAETATGFELLEQLEGAGCCVQVLSEVKELLGLSQDQTHLVDTDFGRQTQLQQPISDAALFMAAAQGTPLAHPPGGFPSPAEFMSQIQVMIQAAVMTSQNSTMEALTTKLDQVGNEVASLKASSYKLQADVQALKSQAKPPSQHVNYLGSLTTSMPGRKAWCQAVRLKDKLVVAGGFKGSTQPCTKVFVLHILSGEWYESEPTPHALSSLTADPDGSLMFVIGGCPASGGQAVDTVFTLSSDLQQKVTLPSLNLPRCRAASTIYQGRLFVLGGEDSWHENEYRSCISAPSTYTLQILDLECRTWSPGPGLVRENPWLDCYSLVALGSLLVCDRRHVFDIENMAWQENDLPHRPSGYSTALSIMDNRLLVFGGDHDIKDVHELSDDMQSWRLVGEMATPRRHAAACTVGDSVYIIGGQAGNLFFDTVECFSCRFQL